MVKIEVLVKPLKLAVKPASFGQNQERQTMNGEKINCSFVFMKKNLHHFLFTHHNKWENAIIISQSAHNFLPNDFPFYGDPENERFVE